MSMTKSKLCDSLLTWIQIFHVPSSCARVEELTSGVTIAQVLHQIDAAWFNKAWLGRIKEEANDNWRLRVSNLKKILQSILEYYHDALGQQISDCHLPDVNLIGERADPEEMGRLLQLVLGCAVSCEKKQEQIQQIMTLEETVQHELMTAIQELLTPKDTVEPAVIETYGDFDYQSRKYYFLSDDLEEDDKDDLPQRCQDLEQQVSVLLEEKNTLIAENKTLQEKLANLDSFSSTSVTGKKLLLLQSQLEQLQEENFRLESAKDDYRIRCEELDKEIIELHHRNEDLTSLAEEAQALKDEMDILRHSSDKVNKLEAMVETYKRKLEDLGDLRRQVKLLEERNMIYMQKTCELEEEQRKAGSVRNQLETYKKQVQELHSKHAEEAMKAEKWQFEYKNLKEKYEALRKEKESLTEERDTLRETNDELRCSQVQQKYLSMSEYEPNTDPMSSLAAEIMPTELKDTIVRLQQENKMLCSHEEMYQRKLAETTKLLEEANRSRNTLEVEHRLYQQQIAQLKSQVEDLQKSLQVQGSRAEDAISSLLTKKLEEHLEKLHEAHCELQKKKEVIDGLEPKVDSITAKKIDELQEILKKKDEDMKAMEERYKRYVEKARTVIKTLEPQQQTVKVAPEIRALKNQLQEKDMKLRHLEMDFEKSKAQREQEERLIISAWYNMGMSLHQRVSEERTQNPTHAQSFLAQQRLATSARRGHMARTQQQLPPR